MPTDYDVPPKIGENEGMPESVRKGYAAFLNGNEPSQNPYTLRLGESFSGFKRRREKNWDQGWKLAAVRVGDYDTLEAVEDDHDNLYRKKPRSPRCSLYESPGRSPTALDIHREYVYRVNGGEWRTTRHDAIGDAAEKVHEEDMPFGDDKPPVRYLRLVSAHGRVRRPQLPPEGGGGAGSEGSE